MRVLARNTVRDRGIVAEVRLRDFCPGDGGVLTTLFGGESYWSEFETFIGGEYYSSESSCGILFGAKNFFGLVLGVLGSF